MAMFVLLNPCFYCYGMCIYKYSLYDTVHFYKKKFIHNDGYDGHERLTEIISTYNFLFTIFISAMNYFCYNRKS